VSDRLLGDWLQSYLDVTSNLEAKESLHRWTGLVCLAAALRRKVHIEMEYGPVYPNLYVFIVAESAAARKTTAMVYGRKLLLQAFPDLQIFGDDMTPQGLIKYMYKKAPKDKKEPQGDFVLFSDELANLFGTERHRASKMVILLTTTYMCPDVYDHMTVRDSLERLYNLYPVVEAATDPKNLTVLPADAVAGLTGRIIWVIEKEKRHANPGWLKPLSREALERQALREALIHDLQHISGLQGIMTAEPDAEKMYSAWYELMSGKKTGDKNTDAFYHRCHATAIQLAQLLSISERDNLVISSVNMARAIKMIEDQLPEVRRVTKWSGTEKYEQQRTKYITYLEGTPGRRALRRNLLRHVGVTVDEFDQITLTLVEDGTIEQPKVRGSEILIMLTENGAKPND